MKPELESYLWDETQKNGLGNPFPREVIEKMVKGQMIESPKQAWRTLEKWSSNGKYSYGICLDLGWKKYDHTT